MYLRCSKASEVRRIFNKANSKTHVSTVDLLVYDVWLSFIPSVKRPFSENILFYIVVYCLFYTVML